MSVQTNGQSPLLASGGEGGKSVALLASASLLDEDWKPTSAREALAAGLTSYYVKTPPLPQLRIKKNGEWFTIPSETIYGPHPCIEVKISLQKQEQFLASLAGIEAPGMANSFGGSAAAAYSGPSSQSTRGPVRKPKMGHIGKSGTYGIAYDTFSGGMNCNPPTTGFPISPYYVKIDGLPTGTSLDAPARPGFELTSQHFNQRIKKGGYKASFVKPAKKWTVADLTGTGGIFNSVNLGVLITHGSYGETTESDFVLHTYLWHSGGTYARFGDLRLGSSGPSGLRWMTMFTCSTLHPDNIASMENHLVLGNVITEDLHLLLSAEDVLYYTPRTAWNYATNLVAEQTIPESWFDALSSSLASANPQPPIGTEVWARVMGWNPCFNDSLHFYNDPDPNDGIQSVRRKVWPP